MISHVSATVPVEKGCTYRKPFWRQYRGRNWSWWWAAGSPVGWRRMFGNILEAAKISSGSPGVPFPGCPGWPGSGSAVATQGERAGTSSTLPARWAPQCEILLRRARNESFYLVFQSQSSAGSEDVHAIRCPCLFRLQRTSQRLAALLPALSHPSLSCPRPAATIPVRLVDPE